jgi:hypothetical protein
LPVVAADANPVVAPAPVTDASASQVLFLGEEAILAQTSGSISGSLILVAAIVIVTLIGAAVLHSSQMAGVVFNLRKPLYKGDFLERQLPMLRTTLRNKRCLGNTC